jgi:RHH-type transcriptional regulator, rel operon repressor / antitoxin RelB
MLAIRLPPEAEEMLERLSKETGRSKDSHALQAILDYLEDVQDSHIAERRWQEFKESGATATPLEDVMKKYGVER